MTSDITILVQRFTDALGKPVATPEFIYTATGDRQRSPYRCWRWGCPVCLADRDDPLGIYRPLEVTSRGRVTCDASGCAVADIAAAVRQKLMTDQQEVAA